MHHVLSKYGVYTNHLAALSVDDSIKSADRAKLAGFYKKWTEVKYLIGCAVFIDIYPPVQFFQNACKVKR